MTVLNRLTSAGPKRILSLDGGGVRGIITLGYLQRIEDILRQRYGNNSEFRLCHYFDLIGGTSTGSIIATCLSLGMSVQEIHKLYFDLSSKIFGKKQSLYRRFTGAKFSPASLEKALKDQLGDLTIGSNAVKTGLCIVTKRVDTGSTWPLLNHPKGKYFNQNKGILLRKAIRASTAAPTYFSPERIEVGNGEDAIFIDGGVSMYNNPALLMFLISTLEEFKFNWSTGADNLLLASIGTGSGLSRKAISKVSKNRVWDWGKQIPNLLMRDAAIQSHLLLQYLSNSPTRSAIDSEIGDMRGDLLGGSAHLNYLRYDVNFETNELNSLGFTDVQVDKIFEMSDPKNIDILQKIGKKSAESKMNNDHFPKGFDISFHNGIPQLR
ncbi:patatin [Rudanella paleaurantiibacter]|uniref:Patatin n=1 Tax=Rudanella paleaurantiibacter TaxID=2614655 RepID=A0A7J5TRY7_9BACT|nr:patatin-like phospholipase family protein [Rudanella paleaurantiibacter]KAB7725848.1 patatin [Rudanella paleaurantiibacter]